MFGPGTIDKASIEGLALVGAVLKRPYSVDFSHQVSIVLWFCIGTEVFLDWMLKGKKLS
jgi:hypothetical protein